MAASKFVKLLSMYLALAFAAPLFASYRPFDSKRDPEQDLLAAEKQAEAEHKHIFLDFGANWCSACLDFDRVLRESPELASQLARSYVVVHVDMGGQFLGSKKATAFAGQFPRFKTLPHVMILTAGGKLLHDERIEDLMTNNGGLSYSRKVLANFFEQWSAAS